MKPINLPSNGLGDSLNSHRAYLENLTKYLLNKTPSQTFPDAQEELTETDDSYAKREVMRRKINLEAVKSKPKSRSPPLSADRKINYSQKMPGMKESSPTINTHRILSSSILPKDVRHNKTPSLSHRANTEQDERSSVFIKPLQGVKFSNDVGNKVHLFSDLKRNERNIVNISTTNTNTEKRKTNGSQPISQTSLRSNLNNDTKGPSVKALISSWLQTTDSSFLNETNISTSDRRNRNDISPRRAAVEYSPLKASQNSKVLTPFNDENSVGYPPKENKNENQSESSVNYQVPPMNSPSSQSESFDFLFNNKLTTRSKGTVSELESEIYRTKKEAMLLSDNNLSKDLQIRALKVEIERLNDELQESMTKCASLQKELNSIAVRAVAWLPMATVPAQSKENGENQESIELKNQNAALQAKIKELEALLQEEKASSVKYKEMLTETKTQAVTQTQQLLEGLLKESANREIKLRENMKKYEVENQKQSKHNAELSRLREALEAKVQQQKAEIQSLQAEIDNSVSMVEGLKSDRVRTEQNYQIAYVSKVKEIEALKKDFLDVLRRNHTLKTDYEHLESDLQRSHLRNKELLNEISALQEERVLLQKNLKELKLKSGKDLDSSRRSITRSKNPQQAVADLRQVELELKNISKSANEEVSKKLKEITKKLSESVDLLAGEIEYIDESRVGKEEEENFEKMLEDEEVLTREKSFTLGKSPPKKETRKSVVRRQSELKQEDGEVTSRGKRKSRFSKNSEELAEVYNQLSKLQNQK